LIFTRNSAGVGLRKLSEFTSRFKTWLHAKVPISCQSSNVWPKRNTLRQALCIGCYVLKRRKYLPNRLQDVTYIS